MNAWRLIAILEKCDPSFQDLLYPKALRCPLAKRTVRAIEEHWSAYFPTKKECRGKNWSLSISENDPLYEPRAGSVQELKAWKQRIKGTIAEGRACGADISWRRFLIICQGLPRLHPFLRDFKALAEFLIKEEAMWPNPGSGGLAMEEYVQQQIRALFAPGSLYQFSDPQRLHFLRSSRPTVEKLLMINLMRYLFDRPLMLLAVLQKCGTSSRYAPFWLDLYAHVSAIIKTPDPFTFRKTWLEHAMQTAGAVKQSGKSCPRKWAQLLLAEEKSDLLKLNAKAVEVNSWLKNKKLPSVANIRRTWQAVVTAKLLPSELAEAGGDIWLFSWMITVWLEKHFAEVAAELGSDTANIRRFYRRFFYYLKLDFALGCKGAGG